MCTVKAGIEECYRLCIGGVGAREGAEGRGLGRRYMTGSSVGIASEVRGLGRGWSWEGALRANCKLAMGRGEIERGKG